MFIKTKYLPKRIKAINIFGYVFYKEDLTLRLYTHEYIHTLQMKELLYIGFYLLYIVNWIINLFRFIGKSDYIGKCHDNIVFEKEAISNQYKKDFLNYRKKFNWVKYI